MKNIIAALLLISSLSCLAQSAAEFRHGALCKEDPTGYDSRIEVSQEAESEDSINFRMVFSYGACQSLDRALDPIRLHPRMLQLSRSGFTIPFKKLELQVVDFKLLTPTKLEAYFSLDKKAFAKKDTRRFILEFWAQTWVGFFWEMTFKQSENEVSVDVQGYAPPL